MMCQIPIKYYWIFGTIRRFRILCLRDPILTKIAGNDQTTKPFVETGYFLNILVVSLGLLTREAS